MAGDVREIRFRRSDAIIAYTFLRLIFGINFFNRGLTRIGNIPEFVTSQVGLYKGTFVPPFLVAAPAYLIPPVELIIGLLLLLGLATRSALITGFALMFILMSGVTLLQNWSAATSQLTYCLIFFVLLVGSTLNTISLDHFLKRRGKTSAYEPEQSKIS